MAKLEVRVAKAETAMGIDSNVRDPALVASLQDWAQRMGRPFDIEDVPTGITSRQFWKDIVDHSANESTRDLVRRNTKRAEERARPTQQPRSS
jgi:hypothetical protein